MIMSRTPVGSSLRVEPTRLTPEVGPHVTCTTFRPCRYHRCGPQHGDRVLRRVGSRGRGHADLRGGRVPGHRDRHPGLAHRDRHAAAPDGGTRLELSSFVRPDHEPGSPVAMANELGVRNVAFEVDDLQAAVERLAADGYELVSDIGEYE